VKRVQRSGRSEVVVSASLDAVWQVVSDIARTGEWSHECVDVRWLDGAREAAPGVRFRGRNRAGWVRWARTCEFVSVEAPRLVAWRVIPTALYPDSTEWRISLAPADGGTRIVQEFEVVRAPSLLEPLYLALVPSHEDRTAQLVGDLTRLGAVASRRATASAGRDPR
jgi:uncharacterized protein YndB with AHSA1/START domain